MKLELSLHASKLKNIAGAFKGTSDPFAVVTRIATQIGTKAEVLGKTEIIKNSLNPEWTKVFVFDYELGKTTKVAVTIFDDVKKNDNKPMGSAVFDVGELLGARGNTKARRIKGGGTLFATVRQSQGSGLLRLQMKGIKLKNVEGLFSKSDPFFEISKKVDAAGGQTWDKVYRSEDIHNNLNPEWKEAVLELALLCGGNQDLPLKVVVYDHESSGKHKLMGEFEMSVKGFQTAATGNTPIKMMKKGKATGTINVVKAMVAGVEELAEKLAKTTVSAPSASVLSASPAAFVPQSHGGDSFVDYISGGCELNVSIAVDFTGSNGDPRKPGTLHHLNAGGVRNDYERAIAAIVSILGKYDSDQKFPLYGFGAKYGGVVRHCFECGGKPEHVGVGGVLDAYKGVFQSGLIMSGPTVFTEVIQTVAAKAQSAQDEAMRNGKQVYTILLILTDGAVSDVQATARCLDQVSNAPMSIVIVGVGQADFRSMQFLDDSSSPGKRDVAQFVEFNKHSHDSQALTSQTLGEIPDQLTGYFKSMNLKALPPVAFSDSMVFVDEEEEIDLSLDVGEEEIVVSGGGDDFVDGFGAGR